MRAGRPPREPTPGQALAEAAIAFPLLLLAAIGLAQFALYVHAETTTIGAVQDGVRVAAAANSTLADGVVDAQALLIAGLGSTARDVQVDGREDGETVTIVARGQIPVLIPWVESVGLPLHAQASLSKERFRPGGGP
jgi:hypothetical protein